MTTTPRKSPDPRTTRHTGTRRHDLRLSGGNRHGAFWVWAHARGEQAVFEHRVSIVGALVVVALVISGVVLTNRQMFTADAYASEATDERTVHRSLPAVRGSITDTNGKILAQSVQRYMVYADQKAAAAFKPIACTVQTKDYCHQIDGHPVTGHGPAAVARILAPALSMSVKELTAKLTGKLRYTVLKKNVSPTIKRSIDDLNLSSVIGAQLTTTRSYPAGSVLGTVLGAVNAKDEGVAGLELTENKTLSGQDGEETYQKGASGEEIPGTRVVSRQPVNGSSVRLTIDSDVQWYAQRSLENTMLKNPADWGVAVVEVKTGKILAIADTGNVEGRQQRGGPQRSRAVSSAIEPGSIRQARHSVRRTREGVTSPRTSSPCPTPSRRTARPSTMPSRMATTISPSRGIIAHSSSGDVQSSEAIDSTTMYNLLCSYRDRPALRHGARRRVDRTSEQALDMGHKDRQTVRFGQGYAANALQITNLPPQSATGACACSSRSSTASRTPRAARLVRQRTRSSASSAARRPPRWST